MELRFIWIKEYNNIKKTGFNFNHSSNEEYHFVNGELIISQKEKYPKQFFGSNISGVTAIVGENGSGKTNLTEFINYNLAHATNGSLSTYIPSKGLIVLDKTIFIQKNINLKNRYDLEKLGYQILKFDNAPLDDGQIAMKWYTMEQNKYIYYSPTFDLRAIPVDDNLINISTTVLAYNDLHHSDKLRGFKDLDREYINQLTAFELMEKSRICDFILNFNNVNSYLENVPEIFTIGIDSKKNNILLYERFYNNKEDESPEMFYTLRRELDGLMSYQLNLYDYKNYLTTPENDDSKQYYKIPISGQKEIFFNLLFIQIFNATLNLGEVFPKGFFRNFLYEEDYELLENKKLQSKLELLRGLVYSLIDKSKWHDFEFLMPNNNYYEIDNIEQSFLKKFGSIEISIKDNKSLINKLLAAMDEILSNKRIISYEPLGELSSGQKHLLTLYSRFYWAKKEIKISESQLHGIKGQSVIIFIDEGEVALHPEWQRTFFAKIKNYLSELFSEIKIQLILTTHSPFVLSDIPKDNVLFLQRDIDGNCELLNFERENTFGANIYSLLSDSFFMKNTIGLFSEDKMKWVLEILKSNHKDYSQETIIELKYIMNNIGEPIIKDQFEYLYNLKFNDDEKNILKRRIIELEDKIERMGNDSIEN